MKNHISQHSLWQLNNDKIKHQCAFGFAHYFVLKIFLSLSGNFVHFIMKYLLHCLFWPQSLDLFRTLRNHPGWLECRKCLSCLHIYERVNIKSIILIDKCRTLYIVGASVNTDTWTLRAVVAFIKEISVKWV